MPGQSSNMLESSNFFVRKISDNLEHLTTISIISEDIMHNYGFTACLPVEDVTSNCSSNEIPGLHSVSH